MQNDIITTNVILSNFTALHELDKDGVSGLTSLDIGIDLVKWVDESKALVVLSAVHPKDMDYLRNLSNGITLQLCKANEGLRLDDPELPPLMRFNNCQIRQWFFSKPNTIFWSSKPVRLSVVLTCELEVFINGAI